jgi:hypothetical protein
LPTGRLTTISTSIGEEEVTNAFRQAEQASARASISGLGNLHGRYEGGAGHFQQQVRRSWHDTEECLQMSLGECEVRCDGKRNERARLVVLVIEKYKRTRQ